ncbi:hypothetical protein PSY30_23270, partial [Shigella flexneri]|nr:hypothetical protein [Shigella flexneri]
ISFLRSHTRLYVLPTAFLKICGRKGRQTLSNKKKYKYDHRPKKKEESVFNIDIPPMSGLINEIAQHFLEKRPI